MSASRRTLSPLPARERIKVRVLVQRAFFARDSRFCSFSFCARIAEKFIDRSQNLLNILKYLIVPEAENSIASRLQERRANFILLRKFGVLAAIEFDDEASFDRAEVGEVGSNRVLTPEFHLAHPAASQMAPQNSFGVGLLVAQPSSVALRGFYKGHADDYLSARNQKQRTRGTES
jgi:hypothetical protein